MPDFDKLQEMLGEDWVLTDWQKEVITRWWESGGKLATVGRRNGTVATATKRGTRLPERYMPTPATISVMREQFPHITTGEWQDATDSFRDYWCGVPGQRGCKLDWDATWRNWVRKEFSSPQYRRRAPTSSVSTVDQKILDLQAMREPE